MVRKTTYDCDMCDVKNLATHARTEVTIEGESDRQDLCNHCTKRAVKFLEWLSIPYEHKPWQAARPGQDARSARLIVRRSYLDTGCQGET